MVGSLTRFDQRPIHLEERLVADAARDLLRWGSNLFHIGILFLFFGHLVGLLHAALVYGLSSERRDQADAGDRLGRHRGAICFVGLTLLLYRRAVRPAHPPHQPSAPTSPS